MRKEKPMILMASRGLKLHHIRITISIKPTISSPDSFHPTPSITMMTTSSGISSRIGELDNEPSWAASEALEDLALYSITMTFSKMASGIRLAPSVRAGSAVFLEVLRCQPAQLQKQCTFVIR